MGVLASLPPIANTTEGIDGQINGEAIVAVSTAALAVAAPALKGAKLTCSKCGATGQSGCECGEQFLKYVNSTRKADQVAEALRDPVNIGRSDRAIAADLGVAPNTVGAARKATTAQNCAVAEKRTGLDGKTRKAPVKKATTSDDPYEIAARDIAAKCDGAWRTLSKTAAVVHVADNVAREALKRLDAADREPRIPHQIGNRGLARTARGKGPRDRRPQGPDH